MLLEDPSLHLGLIWASGPAFTLKIDILLCALESRVYLVAKVEQESKF